MSNEPHSEITGHTNGAVPAGNPAAIEALEQQSQQIELGLLRLVPMAVAVELGRVSMPLGEILDGLRVGSTIRLDRHAGEPAEIYVNGALFARAEVVVMNDRIGAKIVEMIEPVGAARPAGLR